MMVKYKPNRTIEFMNQRARGRMAPNKELIEEQIEELKGKLQTAIKALEDIASKEHKKYAETVHMPFSWDIAKTALTTIRGETQ